VERKLVKEVNMAKCRKEALRIALLFSRNDVRANKF